MRRISKAFLGPSAEKSSRALGGSGGSEKIGKEDDFYQEGGRYAVGDAGAKLFADETLSGSPIVELKRGEVILVLMIQEKHAMEPGPTFVAHVLPANPHPSGWLSLDEFCAGSSGQPLVRKRLGRSWEMRSQYKVAWPCTLRREIALNSEELKELDSPMEVIVLGLGVTEEGKRGRLRALVTTQEAVTGWLSPETDTGDPLLNPLNLLSAEVVKVQGRASGAPARVSMNGSVNPWKVGGQYRLLEGQPLQAAPGEEPKKHQAWHLQAGTLVVVEEIHNLESKKFPLLPHARVVVNEGEMIGKQGWVRCASTKDGHDMIDTRDHCEFDRQRQRLSQICQHAPLHSEVLPPADVTSLSSLAPPATTPAWLAEGKAQSREWDKNEQHTVEAQSQKPSCNEQDRPEPTKVCSPASQPKESKLIGFAALEAPVEEDRAIESLNDQEDHREPCCRGCWVDA